MISKLFILLFTFSALLSFSKKEGAEQDGCYIHKKEHKEYIEISKILDLAQAIEVESSFNLHSPIQRVKQSSSTIKFARKEECTSTAYLISSEYISGKLDFFPIVFQKTDIIYPFHYFF